MGVRAPAVRRLAAAALLLAAVTGCGADAEPSLPPVDPDLASLPPLLRTPDGVPAVAAPAATETPAAAPVPSATLPVPSASSASAAALARETRSVLLTRRAQLRLKPGGRVITTLSRRTEFGSPRIYAVAARVPGWVLVRTEVHGHHVAWLPADAGRAFRQPRSIVIDLSRRSLSVFHDGRRTDVYKIAIGASGTPTPTGTFAVTDLLRLPAGTPYGCCAMALTARQPHIAQGWGGGDRIAIHATDATWSIGRAVSHGCLRSSEATMRQLMRRIRLGAQVTIHA